MSGSSFLANLRRKDSSEKRINSAKLQSMKTIVVAVDFSSGTEKVIDAASQLAIALKEKIYLVHAVDDTPIYGVYGLYSEQVPMINEYGEMARKVAMRKLVELQDRFNIGGLEVELLQGRPQDQILDFAEKVDADMVIVGTHGHSVVGSLFMGSVASSLVRKAKFPVLVVPCEG